MREKCYLKESNDGPRDIVQKEINRIKLDLNRIIDQVDQLDDPGIARAVTHAEDLGYPEFSDCLMKASKEVYKALKSLQKALSILNRN